jgi:hypothetical protein
VAEPCGAIVGGAAVAAGTAGVLTGLSARFNPVSPIRNPWALTVTSFLGGTINAASAGTITALEIDSALAVEVGAVATGGSGFLSTLAGQSAGGQQLNYNAAAVSGASSVAGYFGGGSFAVDAAGTQYTTAVGAAAQLFTGINGAIVSTTVGTLGR